MSVRKIRLRSAAEHRPPWEAAPLLKTFWTASQSIRASHGLGPLLPSCVSLKIRCSDSISVRSCRRCRHDYAPQWSSSQASYPSDAKFPSRQHRLFRRGVRVASRHSCSLTEPGLNITAPGVPSANLQWISAYGRQYYYTYIFEVCFETSTISFPVVVGTSAFTRRSSVLGQLIRMPTATLTSHTEMFDVVAGATVVYLSNRHVDNWMTFVAKRVG